MGRAKDARVKLGQNKKLRRQWLTWLRMVRYGVNNFTRNAWLTTAATAVMTITLLIVFSSATARNVLADTVQDLRERIDISVYLDEEATAENATVLEGKLRNIENVTDVRFISSEDARNIYIDQNDPSPEELNAIADLPDNPFPASLRIAVSDPNNLQMIEQLVNEDEDFQESLNDDPNRAPSFAGERREVIDNLSRWTNTIERVGLFASALFVAISMLIIFNTIRMAIFNRRDEIDMMKLIGADKGFIRGPFVVEGVMYGFVAAVIATTLGVLGMFAVQAPLENYGVNVAPTRDFVVMFIPVILLAMIIVGALLGIISSRLAVRRYLKV